MFATKCNIFLKNCTFVSSTLRQFSAKQKSWIEVKIPVPWGHIAAKWWGPQNIRPLVAVHGWQDNSGSFDRLIPYLPDHLAILAIDSPGHGKSSWLPPGMFYHGMDGPILVKRLMNYFGWNKISLMGHSMGAIMSFTYSFLYPEKVDFLICIDGLKPLVLPDNVKIIIKSIDKFMKYEKLIHLDNEPPSYSMEELKKRLHISSRKSVSIDNASYILERNIAQSKTDPNKYYFTRDPRLKTGPLVNWPQEDLVENSKRITCPLLLIKVGDMFIEKKEYADQVLQVLKKSNNKDYRYYNLNGTHHIHLNTPEVIEGYINDFIKTHYVEDSSKGGIKDEMRI